MLLNLEFGYLAVEYQEVNSVFVQGMGSGGID